MKTAMLQHIEHLKIMQNMVSEKSLDKELTETINTTLSGAIENAEHFLETEKQQIIEAYNSGWQYGFLANSKELQPTKNSETYFSETYTTNKQRNFKINWDAIYIRRKR